jgi:hypothetical protein
MAGTQEPAEEGPLGGLLCVWRCLASLIGAPPSLSLATSETTVVSPLISFSARAALRQRCDVLPSFL